MSTTYLKALYTTACRHNPALVRQLHQVTGGDPTQRSYYYNSMRAVLAAMAEFAPAEFAWAYDHVTAS
jgi:hypothetical protein